MLGWKQVLLLGVLTVPDAADEATVPASVTDHVSVDSLRGRLAFLASDYLEGRATPSAGLEIAAQFIASQFASMGLEPAGDDGYFQTARWIVKRRDPVEFSASLRRGPSTLELKLEQITLEADRDAAFDDAGLVKVDADATALAKLGPDALRGHVAIAEMPSLRGGRRNPESFQRMNGFLQALASQGAVMLLTVDRTGKGLGFGRGELVDPENPRPARRTAAIPVVRVHGAEIAAWFDALPAGASDATVSLTLGPVVDQPVSLRNVVGRLRGSDPALAATCVVISGHYDHIGVSSAGGSDPIMNGANDDGSGTVTMMELAGAFVAAKPAPRRSLLFVAFFGEELGLLGSRYFARHPLVPLQSIVANVNLEQVGRTDDSDGPHVSEGMLTGYAYSNVGAVLAAAARPFGVSIHNSAANSEQYFGASDNISLAQLGVPAHTLCTAFQYPDYHGPGDHWDKIDYDNMAKVARAVAAGVWVIANGSEVPQWSEAEPRAKGFREAWLKLHE
ncbi:MAG: M28 family peptidase [Planctomycetota bacterium]